MKTFLENFKISRRTVKNTPVRFLRKKGDLPLIGRGAYASAYETPKGDVIKVAGMVRVHQTHDTDPYNHFVENIVKQDPDNPFYPKIHSHRIVDGSEDRMSVSVTRMEKLRRDQFPSGWVHHVARGKEHEDHIRENMFVTHFANYLKRAVGLISWGDESDVQHWNPHFERAVRSIATVNDDFPENRYNVDLHRLNVGFRHDGHPVIMDPISHIRKHDNPDHVYPLGVGSNWVRDKLTDDS